jgi:putative exosortase-associated protein (TIGR04073 family)
MKNSFTWIVLYTLLCCTLPQTAMAQRDITQNYPAMAGEKLVNGIANAATGFVELPKTMILTTQREGAVYGLTVGLVTGVWCIRCRNLFHSYRANRSSTLYLAGLRQRNHLRIVYCTVPVSTIQ